MDPTRERILRDKENTQLPNRAAAANLHTNGPQMKAKQRKTSCRAPASTVKYKSYGDPCPNVFKRKPSEVVEAKLHPRVSYGDGSVRSKPHIIEHHNFCDKAYLESSFVKRDCPLFQPFPPEIMFQNFKPFQQYSQILHLRNNDKMARRVQVLPLVSGYLNVQLYTASDAHTLSIFDEQGTSKVAPGMEIQYIVNFCPEDEEDQEACVVVVTDREKFEVPVICHGARAILDLPDEIHFPQTPAHLVYTKNVMLRNLGTKPAEFALQVNGYFVVSPTSGVIDPENFLEVYVQFQPLLVGAHEGELIVAYNHNNERMYCKLYGLGLELDVGISADTAIAVPTYVGRTSQMVIHVQNYSSTVAYFLWEKFATEQEDVAYTTRVTASDGGCKQGVDLFAPEKPPACQGSPWERPVSTALRGPEEEHGIETAFAMSPAHGECWPNSRAEITITFAPPRAHKYYCKAYCKISGKSERLVVHLEGSGIGPIARFSPCKLDLQELHLFSMYEYEVQLKNLGEMEANFQLCGMDTKEVSFQFSTTEGLVPTNQAHPIQVKCFPQCRGAFEDKFEWRVEGAQYHPTLQFRGCVGNPLVHISVDAIDCGAVGLGFPSHSSFHISNCSDTLLHFQLHIVQDDESHGFTIPQESFGIQAQASKLVTVALSPSAVQHYVGSLHIFLSEINEVYKTIRLSAEAIVAQFVPKKDYVDFGTCFVHYNYVKTLEIFNESNVMGRLAFEPQDPQSQSLATLTAKNGDNVVVPGKSSISMELALVTAVVGSISFTGTIVSNPGGGVHEKKIIVRVEALSIGPILKLEPNVWDAPPQPIPGQNCFEDGQAWPPTLDFGRVPVLEDHTQSFVVRNMCCIPATFNLDNKFYVFKLDPSKATIAPFDSLEIKVIACLDDTRKFVDKVSITVEEGGQYFVTLVGIGVGSTLTCEALANGSLHFGTQLSHSVVTKPFEINNQGRYTQTLTWDVDHETKKSLHKRAFSFAPLKVSIPPHSKFTFQCTGTFQATGSIRETFLCHVVAKTQKEHTYNLQVDAEVVATKLSFSKQELRFVQLNDGNPHPERSVVQLTCQNVFVDTLSMKFLVRPPFGCHPCEAILEPMECIALDLWLEWQTPPVKKSTICAGKFEVVYTNTVNRDMLDMVGEIHFPTLSLSTNQLNFEAVIEHTCKRLQMRIENASAMRVRYAWSFVHNHDDGREDDIRVSPEALSRSEGRTVPLNELFDILPIRASLEPQQQQLVEASFYAFPGYSARAVAVCRVENGPEYFLTLEAESSTIKYSINHISLDVGRKLFNKTTSDKKLVLTNKGKIAFAFDIDLSSIQRKETISIAPLTGLLQGGTRQRFNCRVTPGIPVQFNEEFSMQVAYFPPQTMTVRGEGSYPSIWIEAPRVRNRQFLSYVEQARKIVIQKWVDNTIAELKKKKKKKEQKLHISEVNFEELKTDPQAETKCESSEGLDKECERTSGDDDNNNGDEEEEEDEEEEDDDVRKDGKVLLKSRRDTTNMLEVVDDGDDHQHNNPTLITHEQTPQDSPNCKHNYHRKSQSPITGKLSPMSRDKGKKLRWKRPSFFQRRLDAQQDEEAKHHLELEQSNSTCGHSYHRKSRSSITGPLSKMHSEKVKGLPWLRQSIMAKAEEVRIAKLYGHPIPARQASVRLPRASALAFAVETLVDAEEESKETDVLDKVSEEENETLEQLIEDIDAEVDKLVVLEGFYEPLPYVPFFALRDDEDLSSDEDEEHDHSTRRACTHNLHRKSRSPLTGPVSPMATEASSGKGLHWLRHSFMDKMEKTRIENLYKLRRSILQRKSVLAPEQELRKSTTTFAIHRPSSLKNPKNSASASEGKLAPDSKLERSKDVEKTDTKVDDKTSAEIDDETGKRIGPIVHKEGDLLPLLEAGETVVANGAPKQKLGANVQVLMCNQFELDFQNVAMGEKKTLPLMLYNGASFPVMFKVDKTEANSKGFYIHPDKTLLLPGEPNHHKGTQLWITFQTTIPKCPLGPIHVWVQMNVKEGPMTMLLLKANVTLPQLHISHKYIDFGVVQVSCCKVWYVRFKNVGEAVVEWKMKKPTPETTNVNVGLLRDWPYFKLVPSKAILQPDEIMDVQVEFSPIYKPLKTQYMTEIFIQVKGNEEMEGIHCMGSSSCQAVQISPSLMELETILPNAPSPTLVPFVVRNLSESPVEIYSLDFDEQYLAEEQVLHHCPSYNEDGVMHVKVRNAQDPFWDNLVENPVDEIPHPTSLPFKVGPLIVIYGAPFSGKSTQARLLAKQYKCPIVDIDDFIVTAIKEGKFVLPTFEATNLLQNLEGVGGSKDPKETDFSKNSKDANSSKNVKAANAMKKVKGVNLSNDSKKVDSRKDIKDISTSQVNVDMEGEEDYKRCLKTFFKTCLHQRGSNNGVIFDGLNSMHVPVVDLIQCLLKGIGLNQEEVPSMEKNSSSDAIPKIVWKGNQPVYFINMQARKRRLYHRYLDLEDQHHARVRKFDLPSPRLTTSLTNENNVTLAIGNKKLEEVNEINPSVVGVKSGDGHTLDFVLIDGVEIDSKLLVPPERFNMPYPWCLAYPTFDEVDRYYKYEGEVTKKIGGLMSQIEAKAIGTALLVTNVDGMQNQKVIHKQIVASLPMSWDHDIHCPQPEIFQVLKKPPIRKLNKDPDFPFSFITKESERKEKETKDKDKKKIVLAQGHNAIPIGYVKKTRWVIPKDASIELALVFWSSVINEFEHVFRFEILGKQGHATLSVQGLCDIPRLQLHHVTFPSKNRPIPPCHGISPTYSQNLSKIMNDTIDFGPINATPLPKDFPNIPDTEHCYRIHLENIGQFDVHVEFELIKDDGTNSSTIVLLARDVVSSPKKGAKTSSLAKSKSPNSGDNAPPFIIHPKTLDIKLDGYSNVCLYSYPSKSLQGKQCYKLIGTISNNPSPLLYKVSCYVDTPRIELNPSTLAFGRVLMGCTTTKSITIKNMSELKIKWTIHEVEKLPEAFSVCSSAGEIMPKGSHELQICFKATKEQAFNQNIIFHVCDSKDPNHTIEQELVMPTMAEAYMMDVIVKYPNLENGTLSDNRLDFGTVLVAESQTKQIALENNRKHVVFFKFAPRTLMINDLFLCTPSKGEIAPNGKVKVDIEFNKEKKLVREIELKQSKDLQLCLMGSETNKVETTLTILLDIVAVHSKFLLLPPHGLHFGYVIAGHVSEEKTLKIINKGLFPFDFTISSPTSTGLSDSSKKKLGTASMASGATRRTSKTFATTKTAATQKTNKSDKSKANFKGGGGGGGGGPSLELQSFNVSLASGNVLPGEKVDIKVVFKSPLEPSTYMEQLMIDIANRDPMKYPSNIVYELSGESKRPGIVTIPEVIFEEHSIVDRFENTSVTPPYGVYSREDHVFSFGTFIIDCDRPFNKGSLKSAPKPTVRFIGDASKSKSANEPVGRRIQANFRIENPFHVPCFVDFTITPLVQDIETQVPYEDPFAMFVQPKELKIPPHEFRQVCCAFQPLSMQCYCAIFEAVVRDGGDDMKTKTFKCQLRGEGALPHLQIIEPNQVSPSGAIWLQFPQLRVGKTMTKSFQVQNKGIVPAVTTVDIKGGGVQWSLLSHQQGIIETPFSPGQTISIKPKQKETFLVTFIPQVGETYKREIKLDIQHNPYANLSLLITGKGYCEEVECVGFPGDEENHVWFDDSGFGFPRTMPFTMKNNAKERHLKFAWPSIEDFTFNPAVGHIHGGASKTIAVTFYPKKPTRVETDLNVVVYNIEFDNGETLLDWDSPAPAMAAVGGSQGRKAGKARKVPETPFNGEDSDMVPCEPPHQIVQGSHKTLTLSLRGVADSSRYECTCNAIHFKATVMFQTRTHSFVVKNLSSARLPLRWRIVKPDGCPSEHEMYFVDSPCEVGGGASSTITVTFGPREVEDCSRLLVCNVEYLDPAYKSISIPLTGHVLRPWCHFQLPKSDYLLGLQRHAGLCGPTATDARPLDPKTNVIEFGSLGLNVQNITTFVALNPTNTRYSFEWEQVPDPPQEWHEDELDHNLVLSYLSNPFRCLCKRGVIEEGKSHEMGFEYTPNKADLVESFWTFRIPEAAIQVPFLLVGRVQKPDLTIDTQTINFGRVLVGENRKLTVKLNNNEDVSFPFRFDKQSYRRKRDVGVYAKDMQGWLHDEMVVVPDLVFEPLQGVVPGQQSTEIVVTYAPTCQGKQNFNVVCHVKSSFQINMNVKGEGYAVHDKISLEIVEDALPLPLSASEPRVVNFNDVLINDRVFRKFILTNTGVFSFEFLWLVGKTKEVVVVPLAGVIHPEEKLVCEMTYTPATIGPVVNFPVICKVFKSNYYKILLNGLCYRATISFSWYHFDFGPTFLYVPTREAPSCMLLATNTGMEHNHVECLYNSTPHLEVPPTTWMMEGGQQDSLVIKFMPQDYIQYNSKISFLINGLDTMSVWVHGVGTPMVVELVDSSQKVISFGDVHMGEVNIAKVAIINKSEALLPISFEPSRKNLNAVDIELLPYDGLCLKPHEIGICEVVFAPKQRVPSFVEIVPMDMAGVDIVLFSLNGMGIGTDFILSTYVLHFGTIILGSRKTICLQIENVGELGSLYTWDTETWMSELTFYPKDGYLGPHQIANIDVTFHPSSVLYDIRMERIGCTTVGGETMYLTVTGACMETELPESYTFECAVRGSVKKTIPLVNATTSPWCLYPKITHKYFAGSSMVAVPPGETVEYEVQYEPMKMTGPPDESQHEGSILFSLPDGNALFYRLTGTTLDPSPDGTLSYEVESRKTMNFVLTVVNWTKLPQQMRLIVTMPVEPEYTPVTRLEGPPVIDVPGLAPREVTLWFTAHKPGTYRCKAKFLNDNTGEFSWFDLTFNVKHADICAEIPFNTVTRELRVHTLHFTNPLEVMLNFTVKCDDPEVRVPSSLEIQPYETGAIDITVRLILACDRTTSLTLSSDILGDYVYALLLRAVQAGPEPPLHFDVNLGNRHTQRFQFVHYLAAKAQYACSLAPEARELGFLLERPTVDAGPADLDGLTIEVAVTYEPWAVAHGSRALMTVAHAVGGCYQVQLHGSCHNPVPQGPILCPGGRGSVCFRNVFNDVVEFVYVSDNPAFLVPKGEKMAPKKSGKVGVVYKPISGSPSNGKLVVTCPSYGPWTWVFYLQGI